MKTDFGAYLRGLRESKNHGVRQLARDIGMQPSNYSNMENGFLRAPNDTFLKRICQVLGLPDDCDETKTLFDLAAESRKNLPLDVREFIAENPLIPVMLRSMRDKKLGPEQIEALLDDLERLPEEIHANLQDVQRQGN